MEETLLPAGVELSLPEMFTGIGPGSKVDSSNTPVPLLAGFYENVVFEPFPMDKLNSLFDGVFEKMRALDANSIQAVTQNLEFARERVNKATPIPPLPGVSVPGDQQALGSVGGNGEEGLAFEIEGYDDEEIVVAPMYAGNGRRVQFHPATSTAGCSSTEFNDSVLQKETDNAVTEVPQAKTIFATSTDTYRVIMHVIGAVERALDGTYPLSGILPKGSPYEVFEMVATEYKLDRGDVLDILNAPGSKKNPDMALQRKHGLHRAGPPLCSFEFKGPRMDLAQYARKMKVDRVLAGIDEDISGTAESWFCMSGMDMCDYLNELFMTLRNYNVRTSESRYSTMNRMKPVAQALTQALATSSGISTLYTYQQGITFDMDRFDENGRIVIRVTPLLKRNEERGTVGLFCVASSLAYEKDKNGFLKTVQEFKKKILESFLEREGKDLGKRKDRDGGDGGDKSKGSGGGEGQGGDGSNHESSGSGPGTKKIRSKANETGGKESGDYGSGTKLSDSVQECFTVREVLSSIAVQPQVIISRGNSGIILGGFYENKKVIIKLWNGQDEEGLDEICREVQNHRHIEKWFPSVCGSAIPAMIAGSCEKLSGALYGGNVFLVTEYVGRGVKTGSDGKLRVFDGRSWRVVLSDQVPLIFDAAVSSLSGLHSRGILHGDIALRNLRVEYGKNNQWRAWWVDVGRTQIGLDPNSPYIAEEMQVCRDIFHFPAFDDSS